MSHWFYIKENKKFGPISFEELIELFSDNTLTSKSYVWTKGLSKWVMSEEVDDLIPYVTNPEKSNISDNKDHKINYLSVIAIISAVFIMILSILTLKSIIIPDDPDAGIYYLFFVILPSILNIFLIYLMKFDGAIVISLIFIVLGLQLYSENPESILSVLFIIINLEIIIISLIEKKSNN